MQKINDLYELSHDEIDYRISAMTDSQREILSYLTRGKSTKAIAQILSISLPALAARISSAVDRVGLDTKSQLIALYAIWEYNLTKLEDLENSVKTAEGY